MHKIAHKDARERIADQKVNQKL